MKSGVALINRLCSVKITMDNETIEKLKMQQTNKSSVMSFKGNNLKYHLMRQLL